MWGGGKERTVSDLHRIPFAHAPEEIQEHHLLHAHGECDVVRHGTIDAVHPEAAEQQQLLEPGEGLLIMHREWDLLQSIHIVPLVGMGEKRENVPVFNGLLKGKTMPLGRQLLQVPFPSHAEKCLNSIYLFTQTQC